MFDAGGDPFTKGGDSATTGEDSPPSDPQQTLLRPAGLDVGADLRSACATVHEERGIGAQLYSGPEPAVGDIAAAAAKLASVVSSIESMASRHG